jgi:peptide methionine sulfoxide reductase MsrB
MRWTEDQLNEYLAKSKATAMKSMEDETPDPGIERSLQTKCEMYCRGHGWPVFHDRSRKKNQPGWPDLFVFQPNRVVLVELKNSAGKLRKEQIELRKVLNWLGHTVHVVRSFAGFIKVLEGKQ